MVFVKFKLECDYGIVKYFYQGNAYSTKYNDIATPSGYGGPIVIADSINDRKQLLISI